MKMFRTLLIATAAAGLFACGPTENTPSDAGSIVIDLGSGASDDAGGGPDATGSTDADAPSADAGNSDDASGPDDAGSPDDMAAPVDMGNGDAGTPDDMAPPVDMNMGPAVYVGTGDPYNVGTLAVATRTVPTSESGAGVEFVLSQPTTPGLYPVIVLQHGFLLEDDYYTTLVEHVASHGFVVLAPQMYEPSFLAAPSVPEEAVDAVALYQWIATDLDALATVNVEPSLLGLAGHSRGGKVVWVALESGFAGATAVAGIDPVDSAGGFISNETRVTDGGLQANVPSLHIGAGLSIEAPFGMSCAPATDNYAVFYGAAPSPAYQAYAPDYGHLDMLDDDLTGCGFTCTACSSGPDAAFRPFTAGQLVAFFRMTLQGDTTAETYLTDPNLAAITAEFMKK